MTRTPNRYVKGHVQTLFQHIGKKYYSVQPELATTRPQDPFDMILREFVPRCSQPPVLHPSTERERTPLMKILNWDIHLSKYREQREERAILLSLRAPASTDELHLAKMQATVLAYIRWGMTAANGSQSLTIRKHLIHGAIIPRGQ
jgi:hypothetical protein